MIIYNYCITNSRGETRPSPEFRAGSDQSRSAVGAGRKEFAPGCAAVLPQLAKLAYGF